MSFFCGTVKRNGQYTYIMLLLHEVFKFSKEKKKDRNKYFTVIWFCCDQEGWNVDLDV